MPEPSGELEDLERAPLAEQLDLKVDGHEPLVATSSNTDLDRALNEVRDEMIRQVTDMKTKSEPRSNKHLRDTVRD